MEAYQAECAKLAELYACFADGTRVRMLRMLCDGEKSAGEIAEGMEMTKSAVSHQLKLLKMARLVKGRRQGQNVYYSLDDEHVRVLLEVGLEHIRE